MKLYWSAMSPFVRKVMVTAHETGTTPRLELVDTRVSMDAVTPEVLRHNPLNKIPTLLLDDGRPLYDSRAICEYLDALHDGPKLFPAGAPRWDALRRHSLGDGMMDTLLLWRQESLKPVERRAASWLKAFSDKIDASLALLEGEVAQFAGLPLDIGHVAIGCALGYLDARFAARDWRQGHPQLTRWAAMFEARPSAALTRPPGAT